MACGAFNASLSPSTMSMPSVPPPTYTPENDAVDSALPLEDTNAEQSTSESSSFPSEAQLLICPPLGAISQFQKGYLGASGERAAIEGELQIKGVPLDEWERLTVSLRTCESAYERQIELNAAEIELYARTQPSSSSFTVPSSVPFSIPLTADTPQCLHSSRSYITHTLTATLITTAESSTLDLIRNVVVHTRRFSSHLDTCEVAPHTVTLANPTPVDIQVPRVTFRSNEAIPVYVTIPPPNRSVVLDDGFTLRSVRAEIIRSIATTRSESDRRSLSNDGQSSDDDEDDDYDSKSDSSETTCTSDTASASSAGVPPSAEFLSSRMDTLRLNSTELPDASHTSSSLPLESIVGRSGGACRFHSSRAVKLRLLIHASFHHNSPALFSAQQSSLPGPGASNPTENNDEAHCASITQTTLLHEVSFFIRVRVTYLHVSTRSECSFPVEIPITFLPPPAPLPEVDPSIDSEYRKKHDRPPVRTVRQAEEDPVLYHPHDGDEAGPSVNPSGAPPPFEDAPPPFSSSMSPTTQATTSSGLPTFLESESEIFIPQSTPTSPPEGGGTLSIAGEGILFGFSAADQYDGYSEEVYPPSISNLRARSPPPPIELALQDEVADPSNSSPAATQQLHAHSMNALDMVLAQEREEHGSARELDTELPPPPPLMDDPSDPPPSIDSDFRSAHNSEFRGSPPPPLLSDYGSPPPEDNSPPGSRSGRMTGDGLTTMLDTDPHSVSEIVHDEQTLSPSHAPPPYLNPPSMTDTEHVSAGPPPYVDLVHPHNHTM
ncbi:hypothetical protein SCHPADRAFT_991917 [Schizopora paradoxa]|uniref:Uncharacterized protein n=1 Tax=Schizopora paradoxa TaxID=27342 RepID=A0A0H2SFI9_9AGAM|nr:hypothetical protein SCHPADRAFT_991917 [Schizopora paradoxa]